MSKSILMAVISALLVLSLHVQPAHADSDRTFVSALGDDNSTCTRPAPCRTFAGAIGKTNAGGEVVVVDAGGIGCAPWKGGAFQWVQVPPGERSSRKQPEQSWRQRNG